MRIDRLKVTVVGAGIGGTAAALALAQKGASVTLHERAVELGEVGAGLQVSANGQAALRSLGLCQAGAPPGAVVSTGTELRTASGRLATRIAPSRAGPTWYLHRADLLGMLDHAAKEGGVRINLSSALRPGASAAETGDLLIAADGGLSDWRAVIDAPARARFAGQVAWRATLPQAATAGTASAVLTMGAGRHVVRYPLRGGTLLNLVAIEERRDFTGEGWRQQGDPQVLRRRFGDLIPDLDLSDLRRVHLWGLHLRPVAARWQDGRRALLGDAAHPALPFLAQGANLALEDAVVLARAIGAADTLKEALARYEAARRPRAERVVRLAGGNARRFHLRRPWSWGAEAALRLGGGILARRLEVIYGYDPETTPI